LSWQVENAQERKRGRQDVPSDRPAATSGPTDSLADSAKRTVSGTRTTHG